MMQLAVLGCSYLETVGCQRLQIVQNDHFAGSRIGHCNAVLISQKCLILSNGAAFEVERRFPLES